MTDKNNCPCNSSLAYSDCCEKIIKGLSKAKTAEALMRSRYSAYVKMEIDYLVQSTEKKYQHLYSVESIKDWAESSKWESLEIVSTKYGLEKDDFGYVEFKAQYSENGIKKIHHENSYFTKTNGIWYFNEGEKPIIKDKVGRNEPCFCGSGKKYKKCCLI